MSFSYKHQFIYFHLQNSDVAFPTELWLVQTGGNLGL